MAVDKRMYFPSFRFKANLLLVPLEIFNTLIAFPWLVHASMEMLLGGNNGGFPLSVNSTNEPLFMLTTSEGRSAVTFLLVYQVVQTYIHACICNLLIHLNVVFHYTPLWI